MSRSISKNAINSLQFDAADVANNISSDEVSRGTFGTEHFNDSVVFSSRDFTCSDSQILAGVPGSWQGTYADGCLSLIHPMGYRGVFWSTNIQGPDYPSVAPGLDSTAPSNTKYTRDWNDSVVLAHQRQFHFELIDCASSKRATEILVSGGGASDSEEARCLEPADSDDWIYYPAWGDGTLQGVGPAAEYASWKTKGGSNLFRVGNDGKPFALFFYSNFEMEMATTFKQDRYKRADRVDGKHRGRRWAGGCRVWSTIVYYLKPNPNAPFILKWSPRHMIGCSAASYQVKADNAFKMNSPMINEVHAYQDVIHINDRMIKSLCAMSGKNYTKEEMGLSEDAAFGWASLAGIDRWDGYGPSTIRPDVTKAGDDVYDEDDEAVIEAGLLEYTYENGQPLRVSNGNSGFIAFNYDITNQPQSANASTQNNDGDVSLYNNLIYL